MNRGRSGHRSHNFDPSKDRSFWEERSDQSTDAVMVSIKSYDGGPEKISILRPDSKFGKLGRLTLSEATWLATVLPAAVAELNRMQGSHPTEACGGCGETIPLGEPCIECERIAVSATEKAKERKLAEQALALQLEVDAHAAKEREEARLRDNASRRPPSMAGLGRKNDG